MVFNHMQVQIIQKVRNGITLNSSDPYEYPKILFNYLQDEEDLKQTRECIYVKRNILSQTCS